MPANAEPTIAGSTSTAYTTRCYMPKDIPAIMRLQEAHAAVYPGASIIPGEVYNGPGFAGGENVICALAAGDSLAGYAPIYPVPPDHGRAGSPYVMWAEIKVDPALPDRECVRDLLFARLLARARELNAVAPDHPGRLTFQYLPAETASVAYILKRGGAYAESVYRMWRDLQQPLPDRPLPAGVVVRAWRMPTVVEQAQYVAAYNQAFPEAPLTLEGWQYFLSSPQWAVGGALAAFAGDELVASVTVYWDEELNRRMGEAAGFTEYIFTLPGWRGRGVASYLIGQALANLKDHGLQEARLEVRACNETALGLYRSLGYQVMEETRLYVLDVV